MIALALICSLCLFFWPKSDAGQVCVVSWDGGEVTLPLAQTDTLTVESHGIRLTVAVADGGVRMRQANCPTQTCVGCGWRYPDDVHALPDAAWIVCLPNRVSVELAID